MDDDLRERVEAALGSGVVSWARPDCGLSVAHRFAVRLSDGSGVFVKAATDEATEAWLRTEHATLLGIAGSGLAPEIVAWLDEPGMRPLLLSEDLSDAYWPASHAGVAWRDGDIEAVLVGVTALRELAAPPGTTALMNRDEASWAAIASDPSAFLGLGLCSQGWFERNVRALIEAELALDVTGEALVHGDVRSDNVCLRAGRAVFVDWSNAARGHPEQDLAELLPTLHLEGGPLPVDVLPEGAGWAAAQAGALVLRLEKDTGLPGWLRKVMVRLAGIELEWAAASLGLEPPDGTGLRGV